MYTKTVVLLIASFLSVTLSAQQNVVVLKNGNILKGTVESKGSKVEIRTSANRILVERTDINHVCNSMDEAYQLAQAASNPESVESQIELFHWCMKHNMFDRAQNQIDVLQMMTIERSELAHLNRQVNVAIEIQQRRLARKTEKLRPKFAAENTPGTNEPPGQIAQVGYEESFEILPLPNNETSQPETNTPRVASAYEVAQFSKEFEGITLSTYKRSIEPQLIRNCSNAGCHNRTHEQLPLLSHGYGRDINIPKSLSQRNFYTLMQLVDRDAPLESKLYRYATQIHADLEEPVYAANRGQTKTLKDWLLSIASPEAQSAYQQEQMDIAQAKMEQQRIENETQVTLPGEIRQASANLPDASIPSIPNLTPRKDVYQPKDPFDPEIFNRKFGKKD